MVSLNRVPKAKFKAIAKSTKSTASLPENITSFIPEGVEYQVALGEADVAISSMPFDSIVISGDSDLLYSSGPKHVAIPMRQGNDFVFNASLLFFSYF